MLQGVLTLIIEPLGDGTFESTWSLSQMLQLHVVPGCLSLGVRKIVPKRCVAEEPLHGFDPGGKGTEKKRRGFSTAY